MNPLERVWAKSPDPGQPRGELLTEHLDAITHALETLRLRVGHVELLPERFWEWAALACLFHDAGKVPQGFQRMVANPSRSHAWGQRHEIYSLGFVDHVLSHLDEDDRRWIGLGVVTHHRPLTGAECRPGHSIAMQRKALPDPAAIVESFGPVDAHTADALAVWLAHRAQAPAPDPVDETVLARATHRLLTDIMNEWAKESPDDDAGLHAVLLQGAVTLSDHVASAHVPLLTEHALTGQYPTRLRDSLPGPLFAHQNAAQRVEGHLLLRAPTGKGKTEASLLWALTQIRQLNATVGGQPRLFYTLPYLASINAMAERLGEGLDDPGLERIGVTHSKAAGYHLNRALSDEQDDESTPIEHAERAVAKANASRLFRELLRVTTPYQLMRAALAGTTHSSTLIDSANSVFVFDELHAYDSRRLGIMLAMMGLWVRLGGRIGVVSATLPDALARLIENAIDAPLTEVAPPQGRAWPVRHRLHLDDSHLTCETTAKAITRSLEEGRSVLVVANNVADAQSIYAALKATALNLHGEDAAILLHARFRNRDRAAIEKRILGRYASGKEHRPGLVVTTQVVEVSLDLDFDVLHTSAAPLEALIQRFGRVNRLGKRAAPAPVTVHRPCYAPRTGDKDEYADKVYEAAPTRQGWELLERHDGHTLDEQLFTGWLNEIYASPWGDAWREAVQEKSTEFSESFLGFDPPFDDSRDLEKAFDKMFDGIEGILSGDVQVYREALKEGVDRKNRGAGKLLAAGYLLPLPNYARGLARWDHRLGLLVVDATEEDGYSTETGLEPIQRDGRSVYQPGEIL
ncbi:CRISPR-associated helicase Cas3' [Nocardiopsis ansamitocini]|uniref:CRISPR-associated helicase/endonuclease Cas3 n=1 Tax=Nocardiopsis ansamitocini TaxID=1670832 RepID=A0A9W6P2Z8_9ACTN|nr:CRISPR-associated helicase Cas3' [Nocardiopsis ansamitocini]GLU46290.1 CRISPR-associated helicase/endonuclease Cas3 [Nocardiopsis ansamitocini]